MDWLHWVLIYATASLASGVLILMRAVNRNNEREGLIIKLLGQIKTQIMSDIRSNLCGEVTDQSSEEHRKKVAIVSKIDVVLELINPARIAHHTATSGEK